MDVEFCISPTVGPWERAVNSLYYNYGVPPEVWETGLSTHKNGVLKLAAVSNFKLFHDNLNVVGSLVCNDGIFRTGLQK